MIDKQSIHAAGLRSYSHPTMGDKNLHKVVTRSLPRKATTVCRMEVPKVGPKLWDPTAVARAYGRYQLTRPAKMKIVDTFNVSKQCSTLLR